MKLLILGASDSEGTLLANFADSWREQLRTRLPALIGEEVVIDHRRLYVHLSGTEAYFKKALRESEPDFVVMPCTGYAFSTASVGNRLRRVLGTRLGNWAEISASKFDDLTEREVGSRVEWFNHMAHRAVGRTIGRESVANYDHVLGTYRSCIERLARTEDLDAIIMGTTYNGPKIQRRLPYIRKLVDRFNRDLRSIAEAHRFGWVDRQALISRLPLDTARPNQLHAGPEVHALYAEALLELIAARRGRPAKGQPV